MRSVNKKETLWHMQPADSDVVGPLCCWNWACWWPAK
jgi:hypothetical protein